LAGAVQSGEVSETLKLGRGLDRRWVHDDTSKVLRKPAPITLLLWLYKQVAERVAPLTSHTSHNRTGLFWYKPRMTTAAPATCMRPRSSPTFLRISWWRPTLLPRLVLGDIWVQIPGGGFRCSLLRLRVRLVGGLVVSLPLVAFGDLSAREDPAEKDHGMNDPGHLDTK